MEYSTIGITLGRYILRFLTDTTKALYGLLLAPQLVQNQFCRKILRYFFLAI